LFEWFIDDHRSNHTAWTTLPGAKVLEATTSRTQDVRVPSDLVHAHTLSNEVSAWSIASQLHSLQPLQNCRGIGPLENENIRESGHLQL
jgi:hypothetical protein